MSPSEIAHALESSPPKQRNILFSLLETEEEGDVLFELGEEIQQDLVSNISNEELVEAVKELELDEIVDILQNLPEERMKKILSNMSKVDRQRIEMVNIASEDFPKIKVCDDETGLPKPSYTFFTLSIKQLRDWTLFLLRVRLHLAYLLLYRHLLLLSI